MLIRYAARMMVENRLGNNTSQQQCGDGANGGLRLPTVCTPSSSVTADAAEMADVDPVVLLNAAYTNWANGVRANPDEASSIASLPGRCPLRSFGLGN